MTALDVPDAITAAIDTLTAAARRTTPGGAPVDVAELLTAVIGGVAANLGSLDRLLAGRSGSWEADLITRLVIGHLGADEPTWRATRTAPVTIRVCIAQLLDDAGLAPLSELLDALDDQAATDPAGQAACAASREAFASAYVAACSRWGEAMRAGIDAQVRRMPELFVTVTVQVDADPLAAWWQPDYQTWLHEYADDALAAELITAGLDAAGAPNLPTAPLDPAAATPGQEQP